MTAILVSRELLFATRLHDISARSGTDLVRVDDPDELPSPTSTRLVLVDWADRSDNWGLRLVEWCAEAPEDSRPRIVLFGPHTDLKAHAAARESGLGPMWARSKLLIELPSLMR